MLCVYFCWAERWPSMLCCVSLEIFKCSVDWGTEQGYATDRVVKSRDSFLQLCEQADVRRLEQELGFCKCKSTLVAAHSLCQVLSISHWHWHIRCGPARDVVPQVRLHWTRTQVVCLVRLSTLL